MHTSALTSIKRLRRLAVALADGSADGQWLAGRLSDYLAGAERGLSIDAALGLASMPGEASWWTAEALEVRDDALRGLAERHSARCKTASAAYKIERLALRYATSAWRYDRDHDVMPERHRDTETEFLWQAFKAGAMPLNKRQLQTILAGRQRV